MAEKYFERCFTLEELPAVVASLKAWGAKVRRWLLHGEMGAGKTTFVRAWLGSTVSSPTFTYIHHYPEGIHIDLYRFPAESPSRWAEVYEYLEEAPLIFVEWAEKLPYPPPAPWAEVYIYSQSETVRCLRAFLRDGER